MLLARWWAWVWIVADDKKGNAGEQQAKQKNETNKRREKTSWGDWVETGSSAQASREKRAKCWWCLHRGPVYGKMEVAWHGRKEECGRQGLENAQVLGRPFRPRETFTSRQWLWVDALCSRRRGRPSAEAQ